MRQEGQSPRLVARLSERATTTTALWSLPFMSTFGPKGPTDPSATMAKVLQFRRPEKADKVEKADAADVGAVDTVKGKADTAANSPAAVFDGNAGQSAGVISAPVEGAALSQLIARLRAKGDGETLQVNVGPTIVDTAEGKVLSGSVTIDSRQALHKLDGIVRYGGSVAVEGILKNADLLAMRDVKVVEGRLTFEGMRSKPPSRED